MDTVVIYSPAPGPGGGVTLTGADISQTGALADGTSGTSMTVTFDSALTAGDFMAMGIYVPSSGAITAPGWLTEDVTEGNTTWFYGVAAGGETSAVFSFAGTATARFAIYTVVAAAAGATTFTHGAGLGGVTYPSATNYVFPNDTAIPSGSLRIMMSWKFATTAATADVVVGGAIYRNMFSSRFLWLTQDDQSGTSDTLEVSVTGEVLAVNTSTIMISG